MKFLRLDLKTFMMLIVLLAILLVPFGLLWNHQPHSDRTHFSNEMFFSSNGKKLLVETHEDNYECWDIDVAQKNVTRNEFFIDRKNILTTNNVLPKKLLNDGRLVVAPFSRTGFTGEGVRLLRPTDDGRFVDDPIHERILPNEAEVKLRLMLEPRELFFRQIYRFTGWPAVGAHNRVVVVRDFQKGDLKNLASKIVINKFASERLGLEHYWRDENGQVHQIRGGSASADGRIQVVYDSDDREIHRIPSNFFYSLEPSPNYHYFVGQSSSWEKGNDPAELGLLDRQLRKVYSPVTQHWSFSNDDQWFAFAELDGTIRIIETAGGEQANKFHVNNGEAYRRFTPWRLFLNSDGSLLAINYDRKIQLWNPQTGELIFDTAVQEIRFPWIEYSAALLIWSFVFGRFCCSPIQWHFTMLFVAIPGGMVIIFFAIRKYLIAFDLMHSAVAESLIFGTIYSILGLGLLSMAFRRKKIGDIGKGIHGPVES
jgi:WD40 repeat protein